MASKQQGRWVAGRPVPYDPEWMSCIYDRFTGGCLRRGDGLNPPRVRSPRRRHPRPAE